MKVGDIVYVLEDTTRLGHIYAFEGVLVSIDTRPSYHGRHVRSYTVRLADGTTINPWHRQSIGLGGKEMQVVRKVLPNIKRANGQIEPLPCFTTKKAAHAWADSVDGDL